MGDGRPVCVEPKPQIVQVAAVLERERPWCSGPKGKHADFNVYVCVCVCVLGPGQLMLSGNCGGVCNLNQEAIPTPDHNAPGLAWPGRYWLGRLKEFISPSPQATHG